MTPNFALSLSLEGLKLLHRAADGWSRVGEVPLDSPDLAGDLARLRERALSLAPEGMRTKLLIPDDQIRYLALDGTLDDAQVAAALEGTTPYAVEELVIDHLTRDGRTHVAAVARETLDEAEGFAREHALGPVAFAATPAPDGFPGEPWFGAVPGLDAPVARDETAVRERSGETPEEASAPDPAPAPEATPTLSPTDPIMPEAEGDDVDSVLETPAPFDASTSVVPEDVGEAPVEVPPQTTASDGADTDADADLLDTPVKPDRTAPLPQAGAPVMPDLPHPSDDTEAAPAKKTPPASQTGARPAPPPLHPPLPPQNRDATGAETEAEIDPEETARQIMPPAMPRPGAPPAAMPAVPPARAEASEESATEDAETAALAAGAALTAPADAAPRTPPAPAARPEAPKGPPAGPRSARVSERERMTVFGARGTEPSPRAGRLGLIVAAVALVLLAVLAGLWLSAGEQDPQAGLVRDASPVAPLPVEEEPAEAELQVASAAPLPDYDDFPPPAPASGAAVSPAEAERIYAATGVWLRAPRLPLTPRVERVGTPVSAAVTPAPIVAAMAGPSLAAASPDGGLPPQSDPPGPGRVFARDTRGFIAATAEGTVTPQGLTVYAGPPPVVPPTRPGTEAPPAPEVEAEVETEAAVEAEAETGEEVTIVIPELPARPEPKGLDLQSGLPPVVPPTRPGTDPPGAEAANAAETSEDTDEAAAQISPGGVSLDGLRPARRPVDDVPEAPLPELAAFDGPRPPVRPGDLVPDPQGQLDDAARAQAEALAQAVGEAPDAPPVRASVADALASLMADAPDPLANATPQAVPTARRPDSRPRNFDRVVAQSRARAPAAAPAAVASSGRAAQPVSGATVAPDGPVPRSVASAATQDNAINLRDINLIGVYGKPGARRALIRLDNGRYLRVGIGDTLDGGRVTAIGDSVLNYVKRGRTLVLQIPD